MMLFDVDKWDLVLHLEICLQVLYETSLNVENYQPGKAWTLYSYFPEIKYEHSAHASLLFL